MFMQHGLNGTWEKIEIDNKCPLMLSKGLRNKTGYFIFQISYFGPDRDLNSIKRANTKSLNSKRIKSHNFRLTTPR